MSILRLSSFHSLKFVILATNPRSVADILSDSEWDAPGMEIPNNAYNNFNLSIAIFLLITLFLAYVVDVSNILLDGMD